MEETGAAAVVAAEPMGMEKEKGKSWWRHCVPRCDSNQVLATLNYLLLLVYGAFAFNANKADPTNFMFLAFTMILGSINIVTCVIGLVGVIFKKEQAIRGTFTLLILLHTVGFILGLLVLVEVILHTAPTPSRKLSSIALPLSIVLAVCLLAASVTGCLSLSNVAEWQTTIEASKEREERKLLLPKEKRAETKVDIVISQGIDATPSPAALDKEGSMIAGIP